jgi:hypothetical protein
MRRIIVLLTVALVMAVMMLAMAAPVFAVGTAHPINSNACSTGQADENSAAVEQGFRCVVTAPPEQAAIP